MPGPPGKPCERSAAFAATTGARWIAAEPARPGDLRAGGRLQDVVILLVTFVITVCADLVFAVNIGVIVAILQFLRREVITDLGRQCVRVMLTGANPVERGKLQRGGILTLVGEENVFAEFADGLAVSRALAEQDAGSAQSASAVLSETGVAARMP